MLLQESILLLSKFVKLCPKITILYVASHLAIFFVRLVLYRWLFSSLSYISPNTFIDDYQNQLIKFCGEKKKLQIVNALLKFDNVQIFVFDEPTNNLDVKIVEWYKFVINKLVEDNKYVIVISHDERLTSSVVEEKKNIILMHELSNSIKLNFIY